MGVFGAFFGCIGDGGFMLAYISACRGVIGFKVGTWLCPVREKVRPARPDVCVSAKKFAPHAQNGRKTLFSGALGELFRGNAAGGGSSPVEWCNRFVSFGLGYALSWSGVSSCWVGCGVSRDLVRMSRLR